MMEIETRHEQCADESVRKQRLPGRGDSFMKLETAQRERCLRRGLRLNVGGVCFIFKIRVFRISGAGGKEPRKRELKICINDQ